MERVFFLNTGKATGERFAKSLSFALGRLREGRSASKIYLTMTYEVEGEVEGGGGWWAGVEEGVS